MASAITWLAVMFALGAVWNTSDQLGLATWWIGPRGEPNPRVVQLLPFVAPVLMVLASVNHIRRLPWFGLVASALVIAVGVADLGHVVGLGLIEIAIGLAAGLVSMASMTGVYRPKPDQ